jgi:hypothetical protein
MQCISSVSYNIALHSIFPGEKYKPCIVKLLNDTIYEGLETLRLVLGSPKSASAGGAAVGAQNVTFITITDNEDSKYDFASSPTELHVWQ